MQFTVVSNRESCNRENQQCSNQSNPIVNTRTAHKRHTRHRRLTAHSRHTHDHTTLRHTRPSRHAHTRAPRGRTDNATAFTHVNTDTTHTRPTSLHPLTATVRPMSASRLNQANINARSFTSHLRSTAGPGATAQMHAPAPPALPPTHVLLRARGHHLRPACGRSILQQLSHSFYIVIGSGRALCGTRGAGWCAACGVAAWPRAPLCAFR